MAPSPGDPALGATTETLTDGVVTLRRQPGAASPERFLVEYAGRDVGAVELQHVDEGVGAVTWQLSSGQNGQGYATRAVRLLSQYGFTERALYRIEARVDPQDLRSLRVASRSGLRREGTVRSRAAVPHLAGLDAYVLLGRLASDPPISEPNGFRALLNATLPRKRAIAQLLVRDPEGRVLLCQLTYKRDWDLPGGVLELGESPRSGVSREVTEELGLVIDPGRLLVTDWLPPWGGWDDAVGLVFDGGVLSPGVVGRMTLSTHEIRSVAFCTSEEVTQRAADFTTRRIQAALAVLANPSASTAYTESGRP